MKRWFVLSITFVSALFQISRAQEFQFQNFNEVNGLPSSETYEVFQDSKGFIWIATDRGVSKYNGAEFQNFTIRDGLTDNTVFGFYEDHLNRIWFRTYSGALSYYQNDSILSYRYNETLMNEVGRSILTKVYMDSLDNLWFSTIMPGKAGHINKQGEVFLLENGKEEELFLYSLSKSEYLIGYTPRSIKIKTIKINDVKFDVDISTLIKGSPRISYVMWNGQLLISINRDIFLFNSGELKKVFTSLPGIVNLTIDRDNFLWISFFDGGVKRFANNQFEIFTEIPFFKSESVGNVLKDREGGHWFSTLDHGVYYVPNIEIENLEWSENAKVSCAVSVGNRIYVGNFQGELTALEASTKTVLWSKNFKVPVNSVFVDKSGNIWSCDISQLHCLTANGELIFSIKIIQGAKSFQEVDDGAVWIGNNVGLFKVSREGVVLSHVILQKRISSLFVSDSLTYIGTLSGLSIYSNDLLEEKKTALDSIKSRISLLHQFSTNELLIGTLGEGLLILSNGKLRYCNEHSALGDMIYSIVQKDDALWISTENGIARIQMDELMSENIPINRLTRSSGLISDKNNILLATNSHVWSFSDLGISIFPNTIQTFQNEKPIIYLKHFQVNDVDQSLKALSLSPDQNNISLDIGVISYNNRKLFYRHRLNRSVVWNESANRTLSYYSLQPDQYQFEMQISTDKRNWCAVPLVLGFEILTPFWKSWYAIIIYIVAIAGLGMGIYKVRSDDWKRRQAYLEVINNHQQKLIQSEVEALERDRRRIAKDLHDGVGTALTSVKWIVQDTIQHKPVNQDQALKSINENFNEIILEIKRIIYDLNPPALERYGLKVGLKNFIDRINERTDIKAVFDYFGKGEVAASVSITVYRIVQELITNTLKHSKATELKVHVNQFDDSINLMYEDNGIGMPDLPAQGFGLHNIETRVQMLKGHVSIESNERGTFFSFDIPLIKAI